MPKNILMPSLSAGMEEGALARWLVAEGGKVASGQPLVEIETDKATMELEAAEAGVLQRILLPSGSGSVAVGTPIAVFLPDGDSATVEPEPTASSAPQAQPAASREARIVASPLARRLAAERGVDLLTLAGSGPRGRIVRLDVDRAAATLAKPLVVAPPEPPRPAAPVAVPAMPGTTPVPHSAMRRTIARRLLESKTTIPHFYLSLDCNIDALLALRADFNARRDAADKLSINDFVIKAAAAALRQVPDANAVWTDEAILRFDSVDISVAVATDGGLITPILRDADRKGIAVLSSEMKDLAQRAREGKLRPEEYQGGGFSISNLGMYGIREFAAIINPPQSCILAVGASERRPVARGEDIVLATMMSCTLSVDHRSVDGALGAKLLSAFKAYVERPLDLLL